MGFFSGLLSDAAKGAGTMLRQERIKKEIEALKQRADAEQEKHKPEYQNLLNGEREKYRTAREHYIVSYMFAQVMLGQEFGQRDFSFLDQMPKEYRGGKEYNQNVEKIQEEYYAYLAKGFYDEEIAASSMILVLKDLLYFEEIREEVQTIIASEQYLINGVLASASIFTSKDFESVMQKIRGYNLLDINPQVEIYANGVDAYREGNFKIAIKNWLYGSYKKDDFDYLKIALLHFAEDEDQNEATVEIYEGFQTICRTLFGLAEVKMVDGTEKVVLYPPVDMVIAEVLRHSHTGTTEQYDDTLKDWLETCGSRVGNEQLSVLQNVFFHLGAYKQEAIVLEYMVKNNIARTPDQEQRLKFLKSGGSVSVGGNMNTPIFTAINVKAGENELLYDHRFVNWKINDIQQYFNNLTLTRKSQTFNMVIDEWQKDVSVQGLHWNNEQVLNLVSDEISRNFGDAYEVNSIDAGAAVDDWVDLIPTIYIHAKDISARNAELSFLVMGEQITYASVHLTIMVLLAPTDRANAIMDNDALCKKVVAVKEKHNPRVETFISTMKNILIAQLEEWINQFNSYQEIY